MGDLLGFARGQLLRAKGILSFSGQNRRIVMQGVRDVITFSEGTAWDSKPRLSQLVLIGRRIQEVANPTELSTCVEHRQQTDFDTGRALTGVGSTS